MRRSIALICAAAAAFAPAQAIMADAGMAFDSAPVSDAELAGSYGKFIAPGGVDLAMSVQTDTAVDGQLVLRSVFSVDQGPATIRVFAPAVGTQGPTVQSTGVGQAQSSPQSNQGVTVSIDRTGTNTFVQPAWSGAASTPNVVFGGATANAVGSQNNDGLVPVSTVPGGAPVATGAGTVSIAPLANGSRVTLDALGLSVSHLVGETAGSVIANSVNNRSIDTVTTVQIDIRNADSLSLASSLLRVDGVATEASRALVR